MKALMFFGLLFLGLFLAPTAASAQTPSCQPHDCAKICATKSSADAGSAVAVDFVNLSEETKSKTASCHTKAAEKSATVTAVSASVPANCNPCPINWCNATEAASLSQPAKKTEPVQLAKSK